MINHFTLMILYSLMVSVFFGVLLREKVRDIIELSAVLLVGMIGISLLLAWIMYPFPS